MLRNWLLTALFLFGSAGLVEAQYFPPPRMAPRPASVEGTWYYQGDPTAPCSIQVVPGPTGAPRLIITNENGEQSRGRLLPGGGVVADDWGILHGRVMGNTLRWENGTVWSR